ncbi:YtxH domain-containing protein [uncultured Dokdonia sp.]|uniref:YtxH domain-containing protein n=1 Tax=uncultured Dokdonia sp. TaxID=575653 RepID=UPI002631728C|nr:YtxH domain-containing protein [uncultured Dokdonia sp.]
MNNNTKGILGLLAVAAGALGLYKYNKLSPEEKAALKDKARKAGDALKESYNEVEDQVSEKLTSLKNALDRELSKANNTAQHKTAHASNIEDATIVDAKEALDTQETKFV